MSKHSREPIRDLESKSSLRFEAVAGALNGAKYLKIQIPGIAEAAGPKQNKLGYGVAYKAEYTESHTLPHVFSSKLPSDFAAQWATGGLGNWLLK